MYRYIATLRVYRDGAFLFAEEYDAGHGMLDADGIADDLQSNLYPGDKGIVTVEYWDEDDDPDQDAPRFVVTVEYEQPASVTRAFRVWGWDGHPQRESFGPSWKEDWTGQWDGLDGIRIVECRNSDVTGTNDYSDVIITRPTAADCMQELDGQLSDGIFENSRLGKVEELHPVTGKVLGTIYEW